MTKSVSPTSSRNGLSGADSVIVAKGLCRDFGAVRAVRDLTFEVSRGELFGMVGPDGAGKTTTMRILAGVLDPSAGDAWIDGISVRDQPELIKEHIAYMPQRFGLYQDLTVIENLVFYADLFGVPRKERPARIERLFGFSRLRPFQDRPAGALSGGMKQKLGLACALIHEPRLLLLDEPTNGVDPVSRRDFWKILHDLLKEGISVLVTTAYLDEAERSNRVALMNHGSIIEMGTPQQLKGKVQGIMMELVTQDAEKTRELITGLPGILDVNVFGEGLHVRLAGQKSAEAVESRLREMEIEVEFFKRIDPSMEDAFLSLIPK